MYTIHIMGAGCDIKRELPGIYSCLVVLLRNVSPETYWSRSIFRGIDEGE